MTTTCLPVNTAVTVELRSAGGPTSPLVGYAYGSILNSGSEYDVLLHIEDDDDADELDAALQECDMRLMDLRVEGVGFVLRNLNPEWIAQD